MTAVWPAVLAVSAAFIGPRLLDRGHWAYRCPRLGIVAWSALLWTVASATGVAVILTAADWPHVWDRVCALWRWCAQPGSARHPTIDRLLTVLVVAAATALLCRLLARTMQAGRRLADRRKATAEMVSIVGSRHTYLPATVVTHAQPAAFVLPGRPRTIVLTSAALTALTTAEVEAVVAHEKAHADGHHQLLLDVARLLHRVWPTLALLNTTYRQIRRLVELHADAVAIRHHDRGDLATALVAMARVEPDGAGLVAANGGDALERLTRLLEPPPPLSMPTRLLAYAAIGAAAAAPALLLALSWAA